jgi:hypothetical protein
MELEKVEKTISEKVKALNGVQPDDEQRKELQKLFQLKNRLQIEKAKKSRGLGDTIKKVTNVLGIKQCGACKKRQAKLNEMFPYK